MPLIMDFYRINVTVYDIGNLSNSISIPINIHSINETLLLKTFSMNNTSLTLILSFFVIIFIASILIGICFLCAFVFRRKNSRKNCLCCYSCFNIQQKSIRNSSCESMNSSNERADSSQKTTIEVIEDGRVSVFLNILSFFFMSRLYCQLTPIDDFLLYFDHSYENRCAHRLY